MRLLLINPPHAGLGRRISGEYLPPFGLLSIGGPLRDAGHEVQLLDAQLGPLSVAALVKHALIYAPQIVLIGHSTSTSAHPAVVEVTRAIRTAMPEVWIAYGGVFPTFHARDIMAREPQIDFIIYGEGEETSLRLIHALGNEIPLSAVPGIVFRNGTISAPIRAARENTEMARLPQATLPAELITDLDAYRVGWELVDLALYTGWGRQRAITAQFSRGCPHHCNRCGTREF